MYLPLLFIRQRVPVEGTDTSEAQQEQCQLPIYQLPQAPLPHEQQPCESATGGRCHLILVAHSHSVDTTSASEGE
jgi:hypothetical protein